MKIRPVKLRLGIMCTAVVCAALGVICLAAHVSADNQQGLNPTQPITRVEEDWKITIGTPDPDLNAPQITMVMSPYTSAIGHHAVFEVNSQTQPDYVAGGLQLQRWFGQENFEDVVGPGDIGVLQTPNEVVTFTMSMEVQGSTLSFGVSNGNSQTWGQFGNGNSMNLSVAFDRTNLNTYDPQASLAYSYVGFGSNRVQQVVRTAVRYYSNGTLLNTDTTQPVLWQYSGQ
ncbi:MAG TPA: hypothetical protein VGP63_23790 [Planctomycetaceae bacterium]|jgi:hypothetical protein|nr:hypothetical protein [Planctomycetaceae bacterium]